MRGRRLGVARTAVVLGGLAMLAACAGDRPHPVADSGAGVLSDDLALAVQAQQQARAAQQIVSPAELGQAAPAAQPAADIARTEAPHTRVIEHVVYRTAPASYAPATYEPAPATTYVPNTYSSAPTPAPTYDPYAYDRYPAPRREGTYDSGYGAYGAGGYGRGGYGGYGGGYGRGGYGTVGGPVYRTGPQGHAQRDGAIGAVAGAMVGVATSARKDRLKGGLLGAVAGGALGALYGRTIDRGP